MYWFPTIRSPIRGSGNESGLVNALTLRSSLQNHGVYIFHFVLYYGQKQTGQPGNHQNGAHSGDYANTNLSYGGLFSEQCLFRTTLDGEQEFRFINIWENTPGRSISGSSFPVIKTWPVCLLDSHMRLPIFFREGTFQSYGTLFFFPHMHFHT